MDSLSIREILSKARKKLECPRCGSITPPQNINLTLKEQKKCLFSVQCQKCSLSFGGEILLHTSTPSQEEKMNASSRLKAFGRREQIVSIEEKGVLEKQLRLGKSFTELFKPSSS